MTRYIAFVVLMLAGLVATAQSRISVKEETYDDMETTAMVNPEKDRNNRDCALVIFHNVEPDGYYFDAGSVFIKAQNHVSRETGEKTIFLYISEGAKVLNLRHRDDGIMSLRYEFVNGPLESRRTYHVFLGKVVPANANAKQYLRFKITPPSASLEVEEQPGVFVPWAIDIASGIAAKLLPLGDYAYTVKAKQYQPTAGKVSMIDASRACDEVVTLKPAFGVLEIAPVSGATVFIDGENVADYKSLRLDPGEHTVKISRPKYKLYQKNVVITVGQTTVLNPDFEANFAAVRLRASAPDVKISLREATSDRVLGTGEWTGDLDAGSYTVISSAPGHRESTHNFEVVSGSRNLTVDLPAPTPVYGSVNVSSSPMGARIKIDGKDSGSTPMMVGNVLVGKHSIEISAPGKELYTASIEVRENEICDVNASLKEQLATAPVRNSSPAIDNGGSYSSAGVNDFSKLPDFVTHPMGYSGLWNFGDEKKTLGALVDYFKGIDSTFEKDNSGDWTFSSSRHYTQKIAGYDFEFGFIYPRNSILEIYYRTANKSILPEMISKLSALNPGNVYRGSDFAIISD
ncbi:MAG: PEGA domain-containing protein, partial [Muribaculaceae bacterium]|nr:PEGA domain-containing protein [Muribaculaceae bacterium]